MSNFWKNASIMAGAEIFLKLKALIMLPFITRYLGPLNYGVWSQVMIIVSLLTPLVFFGMESSLSRFLPGEPLEKQKQDFSSWLLFGFVTSCLLLILLSICSNQFSRIFFGSAKEYPLFVILAGLNLVTTNVLTGIRYWFRVQNSAWALFLLTIIQNLVQMLVLIGVLFAKQGILELVVWSLYADAIIIFVYIAYLYVNDIFKRPNFDWLKKYFKFGIVLVPSGYAVWALNSLDRVFLAQYHTLSDIGVYSICFTIGYTLIQIIVNPIWSLFPTKSAELYNLNRLDELNIIFNQSIKLICWVVFPAIFGLLIVGDQLLTILTTAEFANGALVIPVILSGYLFSMLSSYFETVLFLRNKQYYSTYFTITSSVANLLLNFILIPRYSYIGAAIATTLAFGLQLSLSIYFSSKEQMLTLNKKVIWQIFVGSLLMYLVLALVKGMLTNLPTLFAMLSLIACGVIIYAVYSWYAQIYRPSALFAIYKGDLEHA